MDWGVDRGVNFGGNRTRGNFGGKITSDNFLPNYPIHFSIRVHPISLGFSFSPAFFHDHRRIHPSCQFPIPYRTSHRTHLIGATSKTSSNPSFPILLPPTNPSVRPAVRRTTSSLIKKEFLSVTSKPKTSMTRIYMG